MPNIVYYATFDESISILGDLCSQGFRVIVEEGPADEPKSPSFDSVTPALVERLKKGPTYFLAGSFTRFPVQYHHLENGPAAGKYTINVLAGGPLMQSSVARVREVDGKKKLLQGEISHQKQYRNPETNEWEQASKEVKAAFKKATEVIVRRCVRREGADSYIAPEAKKLLDSGEARI